MMDASGDQQARMHGGPSAAGLGLEPSAEPSPQAREPETTGQPGEGSAGLADDGAGVVRLGAEIAMVRALLEERLRYDATKEEAFQRLYEDLEQFRGEASFVQTRPLYLDLALLLDRLHWTVEQWRERYPEAVVGFLVSLEEEVEEILARQAVVRVPASAGLFDPEHHRAVQVEETQDPEEHNSITRVVRRGYEWNGRLLRAEEVIVRRFQAAKGRGEQHD